MTTSRVRTGCVLWVTAAWLACGDAPPRGDESLDAGLAPDAIEADTRADAPDDDATDDANDAGACGPAAVERAPVDTLPVYEAPQPLLDDVTDADAWWCHARPTLLQTMLVYAYGQPLAPTDPVVSVASEHDTLDGAPVRWRQLAVEIGGVTLHVALWLPAGDGPHPVFVGQNACGNHTVVADEAMRVTDAFAEPTCPTERGGRAGRFVVSDVLARGYALATWHQSDVAADNVVAAPDSGVYAAGSARLDDTGVLLAWAWGAAAVVRSLAQQPEIDRDRVAVFGHSRRGKVALLTAALEPEVDLVVSHQSGTLGATLSRSYGGESVLAITSFFAHWLVPGLAEFADRENALPFDQHALLAMVAPRPLLVTNGADDDWADPPGALRAVELADPVWALLGEIGVVAGPEGLPTLDGRLAWHVRPGGHSIGAEDLATFVDFADRHFGAP